MLLELQQEVKALKPRVADLESTSMVSPYAFHSVLANNRVFQDGNTIIFDRVVVNEGGHYNGPLGMYTCPVTGTYFVTSSLSSVHNRSYGRLMSGEAQIQRGPLTMYSSSSESGVSTQTAIYRCSANEGVYTQAVHFSSSYSAANLRADESTFSGFLIRQG